MAVALPGEGAIALVLESELAVKLDRSATGRSAPRRLVGHVRRDRPSAVTTITGPGTIGADRHARGRLRRRRGLSLDRGVQEVITVNPSVTAGRCDRGEVKANEPARRATPVADRSS